MAEYVSRVRLEVNEAAIEDFKSVTEKEVELRKQVNLMNKTGFQRVTERYGVDVEYVVPEDGPEFDWDSLEGGRLTIEKMNGRRTTYTGVCTLKVGEVKYDGDNEATRTIELGAEKRVFE